LNDNCRRLEKTGRPGRAKNAPLMWKRGGNPGLIGGGGDSRGQVRLSHGILYRAHSNRRIYEGRGRKAVETIVSLSASAGPSLRDQPIWNKGWRRGFWHHDRGLGEALKRKDESPCRLVSISHGPVYWRLKSKAGLQSNARFC